MVVVLACWGALLLRAMVVVRGKLPQEEVPRAIIKCHWWGYNLREVVRGTANWIQQGLTLGGQHQLLAVIAMWISGNGEVARVSSRPI